MTNYKDFIKDKKETAPPGKSIGGSFGCMHCDEVVTEARHIGQALVWKCSSGHESGIPFNV